jgi:hypothetical protein
VKDDTAQRYSLDAFTRAVHRVADQARCTFDEAIDLMLDRSIVERCSLGDLALSVVEGTLRFDADG